MVAYFQPEYSIELQRIVGIEALARVRDDHGCVLGPDAFIPFLNMEERRELSRLMLVAGLQVLESLETQGISINLSFNVDPDFMIDHDCAACFSGVMAGSSILPERVSLEMLESGDFLNRNIARDRLQSLRNTGVRIALDDVGTAYSSLLRMKEMPIDKIKLDQGFVCDLAMQPKNLAFVQSIHLLAIALDTELVIEGVETPAILDAMRALHLDHIQGYAIARPMPAAEVVSFLQHGIVEMPPGTAWQPSTLLGAYAAHLLRRPLMDALRLGWVDVVIAAPPPPCPLVEYLQARGADDQHPILLAHSRLATVKSNANTLHKQKIRQIETEIQDCVRDAIADGRFS